MQLVIELDTTEPVLPGAALSGSVYVREPATVRSLRIGLAYVERTDGVDHTILDAGGHELAAGVLLPGRRVPYCLPLPMNAPPSSEPERRWELRARADDCSATHAVRVVTRL